MRPRFHPRVVLQRILKRPVDARAREITDTLRSVSHFSGLSKRTLQTLADFVHVRDYRPDEFIYYDGDPGIGLYIIARGRVTLVLEESDGSIHEVRSVERGGIFGELAVLADARRMESARSREDTRVLGIFRPDLLTLIKRHPKAGADLLMAFTRLLALREVALVRRLAQEEGRLEALRRLESIGDFEDLIRNESLAIPFAESHGSES